MLEVTNTEKYHTHITSKKKWFELNLKEVWQYRDLIVLFTKRTFALRYKQTILGPIWLFLNPFLTSVMYTVVFGNIAKIDTNGIPHILFYLASTAIWAFFADSINRNAQTFTSNANVFGKVYFPRLTVPISNILSAAIQFCIQMLMVGIFLAYYVMQGMVSPNWLYFLLIPLCLLHLGIMGMGFGIIISSLTTKYRDLGILVSFGVQLWMYGTPIVYPLSEIGDGLLKTIIMINPATMPIELFRYAVLGQGTVIPEYLVLSWIITIVVVVLGIMIFNRVEKTFMDTV
ncbi:MAG: ABC transporter permease [Solobacterium sp.]|nr:ABC transporter permease [Solobacterium sp.]